jgi:hypothetical protein
MAHDRIHARKPTHDLDRWLTGTVADITHRDGHCVVTVDPGDGDDRVDLVVTFAVRDLFLSRLDMDGDSPVGERVWYRKRGG